MADLAGRVIEIGAGSEMSFAHYPVSEQEVVVVEPEPSLRRPALRAASDAPFTVHVLDGRAERLPAEDGAFDASVASLVLCSVSDLTGALCEIRRYSPGGELRFYEHVRAQDPERARSQDRMTDTGITHSVSATSTATPWPQSGEAASP